MKQNPYTCGDGGCVLLVPGVPVGMHTNAAGRSYGCLYVGCAVPGDWRLSE